MLRGDNDGFQLFTGALFAVAPRPSPRISALADGGVFFFLFFVPLPAIPRPDTPLIEFGNLSSGIFLLPFLWTHSRVVALAGP